MPFPILFGTTITTVLHYRADCDVTFTLHVEGFVILDMIVVSVIFNVSAVIVELTLSVCVVVTASIPII